MGRAWGAVRVSFTNPHGEAAISAATCIPVSLRLLENQLMLLAAAGENGHQPMLLSYK